MTKMQREISRVYEEAINRIAGSRWEKEMRQRVRRFHIVGAWIAIFFDPVFGITDYLNIPDHWFPIFLMRIGVALATLLALALFRKGRITAYALVAIPLFLISLQNAITYSVLGPEDLLGHNLNYLALFMGAGLFITWPLIYSAFAIGLSFLSSYLFVSLNPTLEASGFTLQGGLLLAAGAFFAILLIQARYVARIKELKAQLALEDSLQLVIKQKEEIEQQRQDLQQANNRIEKMNSRLQVSNQVLEETVDHRTRELQQSQSERDELIYRLSHDFKHPLNNFRALSNLLSQDLPPEMQAEVLQRIDNNLLQFEGLLGDLENYAIFSRQEIRQESCNLEKTLESIWRQVEHRKAANTQFQVHFGENCPLEWQSDPEKLRVLLLSLISNAAQYNREGQPNLIEIQVDRIGDHLSVKLSDQGCGISPKDLQRVTEMFFRADPRSLGTGMGLYIAEGIIQQLGGEFNIHSTEGKGTQISLKIPVYAAVFGFR